MIARLWHGWTSSENAARYEKLLTERILPGIHRVAGYEGAYLFRADRDGESEFITLTLFESIDAVREFAGEDYEIAVVPMEAKALLLRFDQRAKHYRIAAAPSQNKDHADV